MMAISSSDPDHHAAGKASRKRKQSESSSPPAPTRWRSESEQRTYSSKLLEALRRVRRSEPRPTHARRAFREAADRALAAAARGRSRWSLAVLLSGRRSLRHRSRRRLTPPPPPAAAIASVRGSRCGSGRKSLPVLEKKAKVLRRLVPGCRKLPFPTLLEEASDYIAALEMQVRAMAALAEILSASGRSGSW